MILVVDLIVQAVIDLWFVDLNRGVIDRIWSLLADRSRLLLCGRCRLLGFGGILVRKCSNYVDRQLISSFHVGLSVVDLCEKG